MSKLWAKDYDLNTLIEEFTVGIDYILDQKLIPSDCVASLAHATMLQSIGILSQDELKYLKKGLNQILDEHARGEFEIKRSDEDGHTAIENRLVELAGDAGKKIHTGRSRNDQVVTAIRVYARTRVLGIIKETGELARAILDLAELHKETPMPGRTHMQIAMPSSVGLWAGGFAEELIDSIRLLSAAWEILDQNPLGAAAGYGRTAPVDEPALRLHRPARPLLHRFQHHASEKESRWFGTDESQGRDSQCLRDTDQEYPALSSLGV
jgi:argininosuccinate lyase